MEMINKIIDAIFPLFLVLTVLSAFNFGKIKKSAALRFIMVFVCLMVALRGGIIFFAGIKVSSRYFYGLSFIAVCFSVPGLLLLSEFLKKIIRTKFPKFPSKYVLIFLLVICSSICLGKAMRFKSDSKKWITESASIIKEQSKVSEKPVLISSNPDRRAAYYANAEFIKFLFPEDGRVFALDKYGVRSAVKAKFGMLANIGRKENVGKWILIPGSSGISDFGKTLRSIDGNVFVLMRMPDEDFRKKFMDEGVEFPLKLIKKMKDDKKREICLYVLKD